MLESAPFNPDEPEIDELIPVQFEDNFSLSNFDGLSDFERIPAQFCERPSLDEDDFPY
jgi:hypothetical protein